MNSITRFFVALAAVFLAFTETDVCAAVNPVTGDDGNYLLWMGLFLIFAIAIVRMLMLRRKD